VTGTEPIDADSVRRYLESKFGDDLKWVRPAIPDGLKGWGTTGDLDLGLIEGLGQKE
jgi:hypothetical protein